MQCPCPGPWQKPLDTTLCPELCLSRRFGPEEPLWILPAWPCPGSVCGGAAGASLSSLLQHSRTEMVTHLCSVPPSHTTDLSSLPKNSRAQQLPLQGRGMAGQAVPPPCTPQGSPGTPRVSTPHTQGGAWGHPCPGDVSLPAGAAAGEREGRQKPCQACAEFCFCFAAAACGECLSP